MTSRKFRTFVLLLCLFLCVPKARSAGCSVHPISFQGWEAQQLQNDHVALVFVPQLGGRLMQVTFDGHPFLFVNPAFAGKYVPPAEAHGGWINYGGDKVWPMPEGNSDEHHWVLASNAIDDMPASFEVLGQDTHCAVRLQGTPDPTTGLQLIRTVDLDSASPEISFDATMKNASAHPIAWSIQSVSQYDVADAQDRSTWNRRFWAFTPLNASSVYPDGFHVRSGLADDPSFQPTDSLFRLHWGYFSNEVWLDSAAGWLAVVDGTAGFGIVEQFQVDPHGDYPGKATVIFYKNGPSVNFGPSGVATVTKPTAADMPFYMEAEINSPIVTLAPGQTYVFHTAWHPVHVRRAPLTVEDTGIVTRALSLQQQGSTWRIGGEYTPFKDGSLQLAVYGRSGQVLRTQNLGAVRGGGIFTLSAEISSVTGATRMVLNLLDASGKELGILDRISLEQPPGKDPL